MAGDLIQCCFFQTSKVSLFRYYYSFAQFLSVAVLGIFNVLCRLILRLCQHEGYNYEA